ncbi:hypothetical protein QFC21_004754 [Naganishia friedmannii]|uniref:Uncharacterized protein n=1 Tax=Naganishia friedmannii TaxID=89922 RepID=A0ACC2VF77_9TREE|nr:hypothetical protein QFC21_004754 [Naganishia friedmannii]
MPLAKTQSQAVYPHRLSFAQGAIVSAEAILKGEIVVDEGLMDQLANQSCPNHDPDSSTEGLVIGPENVFESGAWVEARSVGDANSFQAKCHVTSDIEISDHCSIGTLVLKRILNYVILIIGSHPGPSTTLSSRSREGNDVEVIPPHTIVYGRDSIRRTSQGDGVVQERAYKLKHLEYLRDVLPK